MSKDFRIVFGTQKAEKNEQISFKAISLQLCHACIPNLENEKKPKGSAKHLLFVSRETMSLYDFG